MRAHAEHASDFAIYARQSLDREGAGLAIARQVRECRELAARLGLKGEGVVYGDNDISASSGKPRPAYQRLLKALRRGQHSNSVLLAWHTDRLHRRPGELEEFINVIESAGIKIHTVRAGELDLATPSGRATARTLSAWARAEVETKGDRQRTKNRQKAERGGRVSGGPRQFGYGRTVTVDIKNEDGEPLKDVDGNQVTRRVHLDRNQINPVEAAAISAAFNRKLAGDSDASIWKGWNEQGLFTPRGKEWCGSSFRQMMQRPSLAGVVEYLGVEQVGVSAEWQAIVSKEDFKAVADGIMKDPKRRTSPGPEVRHLLGGITYCECGKPMKSGVIGTYKNGRNLVYKCSVLKAGHSTILRTILEPYVREHVIDALLKRQDSLTTREPEDEAMLAHLEGALSDERAAEARLADAIAEGIVSSEAARARGKIIKSKIRRLRADIDEISRSSAEAALLDDSIAAMFAAAAERPLSHTEADGTLIANIGGSLIRSMEREGLSRPEAIRRAVEHYWHDNPDKPAVREELGRRFDALELHAKRNLIKQLVRVEVSRGRGTDRLSVEYL